MQHVDRYSIANFHASANTVTMISMLYIFKTVEKSGYTYYKKERRWTTYLTWILFVRLKNADMCCQQVWDIMTKRRKEKEL